MSTATPAARTQRGRRGGVRVLGPAFVAAVAYVDPGNVATNTVAGAAHGFTLLWVVVLATLMAGPVQYASASLGLATGSSLPAVAGRRLGRGARLAYWAQAELVAIATDVAEVVGAAVGLNLLFDVPLTLGALAAGLVSLVLLTVRDRRGAAFLERVCGSALLVIGAGFAVGLVLSPPGLADLAGGLVPRLTGADTLLLAVGIVGATVMPHAVYLHSALTAEQPAPTGPDQLAARRRATRWDVGLAMVLAGGINVSMLVLGTALRGTDGTLAGAASTLTTRVGSAAGTAFAVSLLVSGLSSTAVGTQAGAVIMDGLLRRRVPRLARRVVSLAPALALLLTGLDPLHVLVLSQVCLALGLPFALVPLVRATADGDLMGAARYRRPATALLALITGVVVVLDLVLVTITLTS